MGPDGPDAVHRVSSSLLGPSFRALSTRFKFTVQRHKFSLCTGILQGSCSTCCAWSTVLQRKWTPRNSGEMEFWRSSTFERLSTFEKFSDTNFWIARRQSERVKRDEVRGVGQGSCGTCCAWSTARSNSTPPGMRPPRPIVSIPWAELPSFQSANLYPTYDVMTFIEGVGPDGLYGGAISATRCVGT